MGTFTTLGKPAKTTFLAVERDKISLEFPVSAAVKVGMPVKLGIDGKVSVWLKTDALNLLIGYAYTAGAVDGDLITVFTRG